MRCYAASAARADGVVFVHKEILSELDHHPVRSLEEASQYFIEVADTPPRRGACPSNAESAVGEEALSLWERASRDVFWRARVRARSKRVESCPHLAFLDA